MVFDSQGRQRVRPERHGCVFGLDWGCTILLLLVLLVGAVLVLSGIGWLFS